MSKRFIGIQRMNAPDPMAAFMDAADPIYGTGVDGSAVLDGSTTILGMEPSSSKYTMTSDLYFYNLTINTGVHLQPNGYRIFVKNQLTMGNNSRIGFTSGFSTPGSIAQGGAVGVPLTNSLGGGALHLISPITALRPAPELGGEKYYKIPHQAIRGWAVSASSPTPAYLRGGAGGAPEVGGGIVIMACRYMAVSSGTAYISAPGTIPAGGGVILLVSSHSSLPTGFVTDVSGWDSQTSDYGSNSGTVNYMQLV
jgi:hypothetical protein